MQLNIIIDNHSMNLDVPDDFIAASDESFDRLDKTMSKGVKLGGRFVKDPNPVQRCQYAANKLLVAIESHHEPMAMLSAGYIIARQPTVKGVKIDNNGEPEETTFL